MDSYCPTCRSPLNPARARVARIRGGRVVLYCSRACVGEPDAARPGAQGGAAAEAGGEDAGGVARWVPRRPQTQGEDDSRGAADSASPAVGASPAVEAKLPKAATRTLGPLARALAGGRPAVLVAGVLMVAGMVLALIDSLPPAGIGASTGAAVAPLVGLSPANRDQGPQATPPGAAATDPEASPYELAVGALRRVVEQSRSGRLRRRAAMALGRIRDPEALRLLRRLLAAEHAALAQVQIAHTLAGAGDETGHRVLLVLLEAGRRDVRLDAARSLSRLGDRRGVDKLRSLLAHGAYRIAAANALALLDDPEGVAALRAVLASRNASEETKMRAAVALGRAGHADMRERLVAIVQGGRYHVGAAAALASLGERSAARALAQELKLPSRRVAAALALRRLAEPVDLAPLRAALASGEEMAKVSAAEALLILTAPEAVAEHR